MILQVDEKNATTALKLGADWNTFRITRSATSSIHHPVWRSNRFPESPRRGPSSFRFNIPVFFWIHQREDVPSAQHSLEAAWYNLRFVLNQTESNETELYQSARVAYRSAHRYSESLIPLARQNFNVALIAYQTNK